VTDQHFIEKTRLEDAVRNRDTTIEMLKAENEMLRVKNRRLLVAIVRAEAAAVKADPRYVSKSYEQHAS
jgi:hypothetical protein